MNNVIKLLVVEDEEFDVIRIKKTLEPYNKQIVILDIVSTGKDALELIKAKPEHYDVIVLDYQISGGLYGIDLITEIKKISEALQIVIITKMTLNQTNVDFAVQLIESGASWFGTKNPVDMEDYIYQPTDFLLAIQNAYEKNMLQKEKEILLKERNRSIDKLNAKIDIILKEKKLIGKSSDLNQIKYLISRYADIDAAVLITGESGTGKELIANHLHYTSKRRFENFVTVNCSAIPDSLFESELFGYEKGAFTDARNEKPGFFEQANRGTLFLDEISELSLSTQAKLPRVLESGEVDKIGRKKQLKVNVRIVAATNKDLANLVKDGKFREDLFYRLNILNIFIPPLRERSEDIKELIRYFVSRLCNAHAIPKPEFDEEAVAFLQNFSWKGNVRQLKNLVLRMLLLQTGRITMDIVQLALGSQLETALENYGMLLPKRDHILPLRVAEKKFRKQYISTALFLPILAFSQNSSTGKIAGTVKDSKGPLTGVNVYLEGTTLGSSTDVDGFFVVDNIEPGKYVLKVEYVGYKSISKKVEVKTGETLKENFVMQTDMLGLSAIVVTGVVNPVSKIQSSVSVSTLNMAEVEKLTPRSTAEIFKTIPGIRSESSAGEGNTNITVRGVPISAGGSKYLQLQEDGLPVLQFGDIAFATSDIFLRADYNVARIEAIRGGSASTMASNSPAGIINFISKTGAVAGGSVGITTGLDYMSSRVDFEYGSPFGNDMSFHLGGFLRQGNGPRTADYTANFGGQFKMNVTKLFNGGYARVYFKYLNDRAIAYMPMPMKVTGSNGSPSWSSIKGFDAVSGTMHSPYLLQNMGIGGNGSLYRSNVADGMHPVSTSFGIEFLRELGGGWRLENRSRLSFNTGRFLSPFPAQIDTGKSIAESIAGAGATLKYTDGTPFGSGNAGNDLALRIHMFDTELHNLNLMVNDLKVSKKLGKANVTLGYYLSRQSISMPWVWNSFVTDVNGKDAKPLDVYAADGTKYSQNGLYAYGVPFWGNCRQRNYDTKYVTQAPYISANMALNEALNMDASVRIDNGFVTGSFAGPVQTQYDVNNDGVISPNEKSVSVIDNANPTPVDYKYNYVSYSIGANYALNENQAIFGRYSRGGSAKADRLLFLGLPYTGGTTLNAKDMIDQAELGYKQLFKNGGLFVTGFQAKTTEEGGFEATTQKIIKNDYQAYGLEVEGAYNMNAFDIRGGITLTNAKITSGANNGNIPRRQALVMYSISPSYSIGRHSIGLSFIGQTKAYTQDVNKLALPAYMYVNAYIQFGITDNFFASVNGNNLLNAIGVTEAEEASIVDNKVNYVRGRSIAGRSITFSVGYNF